MDDFEVRVAIEKLFVILNACRTHHNGASMAIGGFT